MTKRNDNDSAAPQDEQTDAPTFKFGGIQYPYFVANRTGNVGSPIVHPGTGKQIAILGADFMWGESEPFLEHLNLAIRDERNVREDEAIRKRKNVVAQNSRLFESTVQRGWMIKIDEFGERSESEPKDRKAMLGYQPEIQSQLMDDWLGNFHIERYFADGSPDVDALLSTPDSVFFQIKIGDYKNPAHILILEFDVPSPDARRSYESDTLQSGSKQEGDKMVSVYNVNHLSKLRFAKKYAKSVQGAMLAKDGELDIDTADLRPVDSPDAFKEFVKGFNPNWWIRLADELAGCFNFSGK